MVHNFNQLRQHVGHHIVCVEYGNDDAGVVNVALECEDCGEVLLDFDKPADSGYIPLKGEEE